MVDPRVVAVAERVLSKYADDTRDIAYAAVCHAVREMGVDTLPELIEAVDGRRRLYWPIPRSATPRLKPRR